MGSAQVQGRLWGAAAADWSQLNEPAYTPVYEAVFDAVGVGRARGCWTPAAGPGWRCSWPTSAARPSPGSTRQRHYWGGAERVPTADLREGELEALPYPDDSFDTVTAFNAVQVQYAADPVAALRELRAAAAPTGQRERAVRAERAGRLEELVAAAGLIPQRAGEVPTPFSFPDLDTAVRAQLAAGPSRTAIEHAGRQATMDAVRTALAGGRQPDGSYRQDNAFRYVIATA